MYYIVDSQEHPGGFVYLNDTGSWVPWLGKVIPADLHNIVRRRLLSNLKHLLVGIEMKKSLINAHRNRGVGQHPVLFEPYYQNLILEFGVAAASVLEGIGSAQWLARNGQDGSESPRIYRANWLQSLQEIFDPNDELNLRTAVENTLTVRDKLHQDNVGARADIDWHSLSYTKAFVPADESLRAMLRFEAEVVPEGTNLR